MTPNKAAVIKHLTIKLDSLSDRELDELARNILEMPSRSSDGECFDFLAEYYTQNSAIGISDNSVNFVKRYQTYYHHSRLTKYGLWEIGYGLTHAVIAGMFMQEIEGAELLKKELIRASKVIMRTVAAPLTQNQLTALASLVSQIGGFAFATSRMCELLNQGQYTTAANEFLEYAKFGGCLDQELHQRRIAERNLFLT